MQLTPLKVVSFLMSILNVGLWSALCFVGVEGLNRIRDQNVVGFPDRTQTLYYATLPAIMAVIGIAYPAFMWRQGKENIGIGVSIFMMVAIPAYLFFYGGGV